MRILAAALVLFASATLHAGDAPAIDALDFTLRVSQVTISRYVNFSNGDLARGVGRDQAALGLSLGYRDVEVIDIAAVRCDSALTDAGEDLAGEKQELDATRMMGKRYFRHLMKQAGTPTSTAISLALRYPSKPARTLAKVSGSIDVVCELEPGDTIELTPASDWIEKNRELPGSKVGFTLLSLDPLKYACDGGVIRETTVKSLEFIDDHGKELPSSGWSSDGDGTTTTITRMGAKLPPQGKVRMVLVGKTGTVRVPIDLADIPLQAPPPTETPPPEQTPPPAETPGKKASDF